MAGEPDTGGAYSRYAASAKDYSSRGKDAATAAAQAQPTP